MAKARQVNNKTHGQAPRLRYWWLSLLAGMLGWSVMPAFGQSFLVQCPKSTITHPNAANNDSEPAYTGTTTYTTSAGGYQSPVGNVNGAIKCQQISGGDGYATMADGTQTYMFSFGPLSGLANIANGKPGTVGPTEYNTVIKDPSVLVPGYPAALGSPSKVPNGAIGLIGNSVAYTYNIYEIFEGPSAVLDPSVTPAADTVTVVMNSPVPFAVGDSVVIGQGPIGTDLNGYTGTYKVTKVGVPLAAGYGLPNGYVFQYSLSGVTGLPDVTGSSDATASSVPATDGHVDPRQIMDVGVMNGNIPAPMMAIDEDDEFFLTLTNVGMIMRPDLFEQHTVHFHGYPNASSFYDGVPDASVAIDIGGSFSYYYLAPDAGTYFFHCHITPPEHLQMGMVGQLYVRPRQDRVPAGGSLYTALGQQQGDLRTACSGTDVLCSNPLPAVNTGAKAPAQSLASAGGSGGYVYNDGDASTWYDVEVPIQMHGFDPNFHFVGMTFNPEGFADMKDKYFLLNGRSYPDTVASGPMSTQSSDGVNHFAQPLSSVVNMKAGQRALLRISDLGVSEYHTLASLGIRMTVVGWNAKLLRDQAGNNMAYTTNSITLAGGESADVILDSCITRSTPGDPSSACSAAIPTGTYYLYTSNLDHLSNDAENFGGQMTVVNIN